jgi:serine/threonine-protein kinase
MTPDRWQEIQAVFLAAADLEPAAQATYVAEACAADPTLRDEVLSLLAAERRSAGAAFITDAVAAAARGVGAAAGAARSGERVGPYRLVREIGHGGMGTVYLAERVDEQYRASVAVKFVRGALAAPELTRRLQVERQILADLTHPNIAWLLDGGTAADGTPYLVMEYVDGEAIDLWCDRHALGLSGRLALLGRVCAAVQHAHQALVVHRDLKPSNILVMADGTPKLVDFGIAKLLGAEGAETTETLRIMTPAYAAPEQVRGGRITVATDVYALGAVLYRLVTGRTPIDVAGASPAEIERRIGETLPAAPSAAAQGAAGAWRRALAGDLDTIILKALRKEPERRYASVEQFAEDLRRHEAGLPVTARLDTWRYRAGKFVRRQRTAVLTAAALIVLTAGYTVQLARERDRARVEAAKAGQVATFLQNLFEVSDPSQSRGATITARELLDRGAQRVTQGLSDQREVQATLMQVIGRVYESLGLHQQARDQFAAALDIRRRLFGDLHHDVAESEAWLGGALEHLADVAGAEPHFREQRRIERALHSGDHEHLVSAAADLAAFLRRSERLDEAETLLRDALAMRDRLGPKEGSLAMLSDALASTLERKGDYSGAAPWFRQAVDLVRAQRPPDSVNLAIALNNQSDNLVNLGRLDDAIAAQREALAIHIAFFGPDHPDTPTLQVGLGRVLRAKGAFAEAEEQFRLGLRDSLRLGPDHPDIGTRFGYLGTTLTSEGRLDEAEAALRRALAIRRKALGAQHPYVAISMNELAGLYYARHEWKRAETLYRSALALRRRVHPPTHPYIAYSLVGLARTLLAEHRSAQAAPLLREAESIRAQALPDGHPLRREVDSLLALSGPAP